MPPYHVLTKVATNAGIVSFLLAYKKEFEVIFIIIPYHPALWEVREQPLIKALIHLETKIYEMGKSLDVKVIGSFNPNKVNCKKGEFVDLVHPKNKCLIKALN